MKNILFFLVFIVISGVSLAQKLPNKNPVRLADTSLVNKVILVDYSGNYVNGGSGGNSVETYTTFKPSTTGYSTGAVINTINNDYVILYFSKTASTLDNNYFKVSALANETTTVVYQQTSQGSAVSGVSSVDSNVYEIDKTAVKQYLTIPVAGLDFIRIDCAKATDSGTDSTIETLISKK